MKLSNYFKKK